MTKKSKQSLSHRLRIKPEPFWLTTVNYYFLTVGVSIVCFFIIWGFLHFEEAELPWITGGIASGLVVIFAVILRELVLRRKYQRTFRAQKRLDYNIRSVVTERQRSHKNRLTLERNAAILEEISNKAKNAQLIGKSARLHREVFEMCHEYLRKSQRELDGMTHQSPRFGPIRRGQSEVSRLHYHHLMAWALIESQKFVQLAKVQVSLNDKLESAQRASAAIENASEYYPNDQNLIQSSQTIKEFIVSLKVSHWIEQGDRAAFKENYKRAIDHYRDALFFLEKDSEPTSEREGLVKNINKKIEDLRIKTK